MKKKKPKQNNVKDTSRKKETVTDVVKDPCEPSEELSAPSAEQIELELDELAKIPPLKKQRVWEVDFLRGLMILFVVWDHFMWDISGIGSSDYNTGLFKWLYALSGSYYGGTLRAVTHDVFVTLFVFTSGVSCSFSRNNGKRAVRMVAFACLFTAATLALTEIIKPYFNYNLTMYFNVIHVIALSVLLWTVIEWCWSKCVKNWQKNIFGCVMTVVILVALIVGSCAKYDFFIAKKPWEIPHAFDFLLYCKGNAIMKGGDYLTFFPDFGWFLIGAFLGRALYKEKKSIFPSVDPKFVCPITFCGRYSIWIYFGSQIVMGGGIFLLHYVLNWL